MFHNEAIRSLERDPILETPTGENITIMKQLHFRKRNTKSSKVHERKGWLLPIELIQHRINTVDTNSIRQLPEDYQLQDTKNAFISQNNVIE